MASVDVKKKCATKHGSDSCHEGGGGTETASEHPGIGKGTQEEDVQPKGPVDGGRKGKYEKNEIGRIEQRGLEVAEKGNATVDIGVPEWEVTLSQLAKPKGPGIEELRGDIR